MLGSAFVKLSSGTVQTLLEPENRDQLVKVLTAHVVPGDLSGGGVLNRVQEGGDRYEMITVVVDTRVAVPSGGDLARGASEKEPPFVLEGFDTNSLVDAVRHSQGLLTVRTHL